MMDKNIFEILRCQQCLGKLYLREDHLVCCNCKMTYQISKGLIFMGYDMSKKEKIETVIATERNHQTNLNRVAEHYKFAYSSYKLGLLSISILSHDVKKSQLVAVDIGSGGSPMSKMLAEKGFDTYRCELDPNSLYSGLFWKHKNLCTGKHIVCSASILPFSDKSIDVIYCKEFVHHIEDYNSLLVEINRVLKTNGILLMIEPTITFSNFPSRNSDNHFGHNYQTIYTYYLALKRNGFVPYRYYLYFYEKSRRLRFLNIFKEFLHKQILSRSKATFIDMFLKMHLQTLIGGSSVFFLKKTRDICAGNERPKIKVINARHLILDQNYLTDIRLNRFREILKDLHEEIQIATSELK